MSGAPAKQAKAKKAKVKSTRELRPQQSDPEDLANRLCAIRILRQPEDYGWRTWEEDGLIAHVEASQAIYLGAVAAVLRS